MDGRPGLREWKKQQTRQRIADSALELFAHRGFDHVRVSEVARAAGVSEATAFNYFPTKEDLIYSGMEQFETHLLEAVRRRPPGTTVLAAFRDYVLVPRGGLAVDDPASITRIATVARIIAGSPALRTREQQLIDRFTRTLAREIAKERRAQPSDLRPWVTANALMGVHRAMTWQIQQQALQGRNGRTIARKVVAQGRRAFDTLEAGLHD
ncbi:MAG TPA: TetR family transcriptional regulator [Mycobacteriales bacterium]|nr:TetR family transcriptional regulator [Mycobacteriales bacterium]